MSGGVKRGRRPQVNQSFFLKIIFYLKYLNRGKYRITNEIKFERLGENFIFFNFFIECFSINTKHLRRFSLIAASL